MVDWLSLKTQLCNFGLKNLILLENYNLMQTNNKIITPGQNIEVENAQFQQFVQTLKEQRPIRSKKFADLEPNGSQLSHPPISEQESLHLSKDIYSERSRSLIMQSNQKSEVIPELFGGDQVLKNKVKFGVASRYTVKQYQLPPQYFTPTKVKLQQYLKDSRILPKTDISTNENLISSAKKPINDKQAFSLNNTKVLKESTGKLSLSEFNPVIALKYCMNHQLSDTSDSKQILSFFTRLLSMLGISLPQPKVEKYRDCIYFGRGLRKKQISEGILYFYSGSLYIGELLQHLMHGKGVQIFFKAPAIYKGDFQQGTMHGHFSVIKDGQKYNGIIEDGLYHGHGRLQTQAGCVEGQFRDGKLMSTSKGMLKQPLNKNHSGFRIRGKPQQHSYNYQQLETQLPHKNMSFYESPQVRQSQIYPWSYAQKYSQVKKATPRSHFNDFMQFSYAFGSDAFQQGSKRHKTKANLLNPEKKIALNRVGQHKEKSRQMQYFVRNSRPIHENTDFGQQQPLYLKC